MIGIVGGMGPYAGLDLAKKVFDQTVASTDQEHLPLALVSVPDRIVDRSAFLDGRIQVNPANAIFGALLQLQAAGATVAGMPCVTAHADPILGEIERLLQTNGASIRLVSIVSATVRLICRHFENPGPVAAISTTRTFNNRIFHRALEDCGIPVVVQSDNVQNNLVQRAIFDPELGIKAHASPVTPEARAWLTQAIRHLRDRGANVVILGCTELPLALTEPAVEGLPVVDPTLALARALIRETFPDRIRPFEA